MSRTQPRSPREASRVARQGFLDQRIPASASTSRCLQDEITAAASRGPVAAERLTSCEPSRSSRKRICLLIAVGEIRGPGCRGKGAEIGDAGEHGHAISRSMIRNQWFFNADQSVTFGALDFYLLP